MIGEGTELKAAPDFNRTRTVAWLKVDTCALRRDGNISFPQSFFELPTEFLEGAGDWHLVEENFAHKIPISTERHDPVFLQHGQQLSLSLVGLKRKLTRLLKWVYTKSVCFQDGSHETESVHLVCANCVTAR
mmetsp:Transcript_16280/g.33013  ORF Transcript_16280/g.33013 Transcript_16280/m.33013 type:complete len:132 (+) Transcript_16280:2593-2988(+)